MDKNKLETWASIDCEIHAKIAHQFQGILRWAREEGIPFFRVFASIRSILKQSEMDSLINLNKICETEPGKQMFSDFETFVKNIFSEYAQEKHKQKK